ncbi:MAG: fibrobacter succinogenes major paralogous domain-containing protein [Bacteroidales bacterium]|nr:fibrobacter succinogenes major paralogous domain-containing protein [Bacteroidales bacterium]
MFDYVILIMLLLFMACSNVGREIKSEQLQRRKDGLFYATSEKKPYTGKVVDFYSNGQKQLEIFFKKGKRKGDWNFWTQFGKKVETDKLTDIDGNTYLAIKIGDQWWMAENLKVTHYRNGDDIPLVKEADMWAKLLKGSYSGIDYIANKVGTYGLLYNWYAVNDKRGLAPEGWHVPSLDEWSALLSYLGGQKLAGGKIKATGTQQWRDPNTGATNESGFTAFPSGERDEDGEYDRLGVEATFWSSTESDSTSAEYFNLVHWNSSVFRGDDSKKYGNSVRCVRNE